MALRYVYQLSLSNGKVLINESDGLFTLPAPDSGEEKCLINSAVLIKMYETEELPVEVMNAPEGQTSIVEDNSAETE